MFAIMYEPERRVNRGCVDGGVTHAVNIDRIEDIYFWGDMACVCLVSGAKFNVTRSQAIDILDMIGKWSSGASNEVAEVEDDGRRYEKAKNDVANLKGGDAG